MAIIIRRLLLYISIFGCFLVAVLGSCSIPVTGYQKPIFVRDFGSKKIVLQDYDGPMPLNNGKNIIAYCSSGLILRNEYSTGQTFDIGVNFYCDEYGRLEYSSIDNFARLYTDNNFRNVECNGNGIEQSLYEMQKSLPHCENFMSLSIKFLPPVVANISTANFCYDLDNQSLKFVKYRAYRNKFQFINMVSSDDVDKVISNHKLYFPSMLNVQLSLSAEQKLKPFLHMYDYEHLIQDAPLQEELKNYGDVFNILWWRNIRLGSWKLWLSAFEERTKSIKYDVYMGTSGEISVPKVADCSIAETVSFQSDKFIVKAPKYIWSYVRSISANFSEEFVLIAQNSPFELIETEISCEDIGNEIDWIKMSSFGKLRLLPSMGVVKICRVEAVQQMLQNFPYANEYTPTTTSQIETTTGSDSFYYNPFEFETN